jgi:hypothetical protein
MTPIERYAQIRFLADQAHAAGRQITPALLQEAKQIEAKARSVLSPQEQQVAFNAVGVARSQMHEQHAARQQQHNAKATGAAVDKMTKEMTGGLTARQMDYASKTGKLPVKGAGFKGAEQKLPRYLKGFGHPDMTQRQFQSIVDEAEQTRMSRGDGARNEYLAKKFPKHTQQAISMVDGWESAGVGVARGMTERMGGHDEARAVELDDDDKRKIAVTEAVLKQAKTNPDTAKELASSWIPEDYLTHESPTDSGGDVARAFAAAEREEQREETANYQEEDYSEAYADGTN